MDSKMAPKCLSVDVKVTLLQHHAQLFLAYLTANACSVASLPPICNSPRVTMRACPTCACTFTGHKELAQLLLKKRVSLAAFVVAVAFNKAVR